MKSLKSLLIVLCVFLSNQSFSQKTRTASHYESKGTDVVAATITFTNQVDLFLKQNSGKFTRQQHVQLLSTYLDYQDIYLNFLVLKSDSLSNLELAILKSTQKVMFEIIKVTRPKKFVDRLREIKKFKNARKRYQKNIANTQKFIKPVKNTGSLI